MQFGSIYIFLNASLSYLLSTRSISFEVLFSEMLEKFESPFPRSFAAT